MIDLKLPLLDQFIKLPISKNEEGKEIVTCFIRKRPIMVTPEELVRQLLLRFLVDTEKIPASLIQVEKQLLIDGHRRRFDVIIFNRLGAPFVIVETKSFKRKIDENAFMQVAMYNLKCEAPYLLVSNGRENYLCKINHEAKSVDFMDKIPPIP